ncbi:MAG TPA: hydrogenase/urease maturation nickel metallochaperone HypA [Anaerolineae bacterium]|nr:hydrogenase/urease maturation nickel metallochaperone HypA [Anaerolineae bacterium]
MSDDLQERARAMIAEAVARSRVNGAGTIAALHLTLYPTSDISSDTIRAAIDAARRGTPAESAQLRFKEAPARYICWNCCGLRFEGLDGICPNCESEALIVPEEILFALDRVETGSG